MAEVLGAQVAVVGAGPAGIAAATRAGEAGADVIVVDEGGVAGGQIWRRLSGRAPRGARRWLERFARSSARLVPDAQVISASRDGSLEVERLRPVGEKAKVRARTLIVATGARERFLPFPGWTLPNVIGVGAAQALLKSGASFRGRRAVVAGSGPLLLPAAAALAAGRARVAIVAEQAPGPAVHRFVFGLTARPAKLVQAARYRAGFVSAPYRTGVWVSEARGESSVRQVVLTDGERSWTEPCDLLCCGYGLVPNLELPLLLDCAIVEGKVVVDEHQQTSQPGIYCAGEATGVGGVELALAEGEIAGLAAAGRHEEARRLFPVRSRLRAFAASLDQVFALREELKSLADPKTIVCRCEDVPFGRLDSSWSRRQAKLYTRAGMGPCQAKVCGPALEFLFGWEADTVRPPLRPTPLSSFLEENAPPMESAT